MWMTNANEELVWEGMGNRVAGMIMCSHCGHDHVQLLWTWSCAAIGRHAHVQLAIVRHGHVQRLGGMVMCRD